MPETSSHLLLGLIAFWLLLSLYLYFMQLRLGKLEKGLTELQGQILGNSERI